MAIKKIAFMFVLLSMLMPSFATAGVIDDIKARQKGLKTISASLTQEKHTELLDRPIKSKGKFYHKSKAGVRWEYDDMLFIYDGKSMFLYYKELEEAEKINGASGMLPLSFDLETLSKDFEINAENVKGRVQVDLKPKRRMPFESMRMFFGPSSVFPEETWTIEESGDKTVVKFYDVKINIDIKDSMFVFTPPKGVRMVERKIE